MPFYPSPPEPRLRPTRPDEVVRPTRVSWRGKNGFVTSRLFPTQERAYDFAAELDPDARDVHVGPASGPPPRQVARTHRDFVKNAAHPAVVSAGKAMAAAYHDAGMPVRTEGAT